MKPTFSTVESWQQAALLMQPVFIRLIDNIRKQLDTSDWEGSYQNVQVWPEGTSLEEQSHVQSLQEQLTQASPEEAISLQQELNQLPSPLPGYELCLQRGDRHVTVDLWEVCYEICFQNYAAMQQERSTPAAVDSDLIDETGEVDWNRLEIKARRIVSEIFERLPHGDMT